MYGDAEAMRRQVARLREQGGDIRVLADRLVAQVEGVAWRGRAADTMRERMRERASRLREAAGRHDSAADSLDKHALAVEELKEQIAQTERRATALVGDARTRVARLQDAAQDDAAGLGGLDGAARVTRLPDPVDDQLAGFSPPAPGHKDWLGVELPGL